AADLPDVTTASPLPPGRLDRDPDRALVLGGRYPGRAADGGAGSAGERERVKPRGKRALVIGFGRSGRAAAAYIRAQGGTVRGVDRADTPEVRSWLHDEG